MARGKCKTPRFAFFRRLPRKLFRSTCREALHRNVFSEKMGIAKNVEKRKILIEDAKEYFGNIIF